MSYYVRDHAAPPAAMYASFQTVQQRPASRRLDGLHARSVLLHQEMDRIVRESRSLDAVGALSADSTPCEADSFFDAHRQALLAVDPKAIRAVAGRLAWRGASWTQAHRDEVVALLRGLGDAAVVPVLDAVAECPRGDVEDAAVSVLRSALCSGHGFAALADAARNHISSDARSTAIRVLGSASGEQVSSAAEMIVAALNDSDGDVRSAAGWALVNLGASDAAEALGSAIQREADSATRGELLAALDTLRG